METITLTFGDCAENHRGMQAIGEMSKSGLSVEELHHTKEWFESKGKVCELVDLRDVLPVAKKADATPAFLLVVRGGCDALVDVKELTREQTSLEWDSKAFMYGRVVNKKARHNLCYSDFEQAADYENGKGTVVPFTKLPQLETLRRRIGEITGPKLVGLQCEGNRYYDVKKTYIGFHGDTERRIVVAIRLGADFPIHYQWYQESEPVGALFTTILRNGDIYYMSEKAVGFDWKKKKIMTLRHAAGLEKNVMPDAKPVAKKSPVVILNPPDGYKFDRAVMKKTLNKLYMDELLAYFDEYKAETGKEIPAKYLANQIKKAVANTLVDPDFHEAVEEDPCVEKWEIDGVREFLFEYTTIRADYSM